MRFPRTATTPLRTKTVAVYLDWYEPRILRGIARFAKEKHWGLILDNAQVQKWAAIPNKVDGLLCLTGPYRATTQFLLKMNLPTVVMADADEGLMGDCSRVCLDHLACGRMAGEYLRGLGFENYLTVGKKNRTFSRQRIQGFIEVVSARARVIQQVWIGESLAHGGLRGPIEAALRKAPKPLAIFVPGDVTCLHVMRCALELGLRVPEDVAILGADNDEMLCSFAPVPLSSIRLNYTQLGFEAAALLDKIMRGRPPKRAVTLIPPVNVISRQSTNIMLVPDEQVAKAMRYIWHNIDRPITIEEIAAHVGISHSTLGRLFRQHLQRSIVEQIVNMRIDRAKEMLTSGKLPVKNVGEACGFNTASYFNNVFHVATGMTPRKFRLTAHANKEDENS
jgi:LacI family transcriptional regulator